jgi:hypothetical protein
MAQFFIRDFDEEPSMLVALGDCLRQFDLVITYNGAAFVFLCETRYSGAPRPTLAVDAPLRPALHGAETAGGRVTAVPSCCARTRYLSFLRGPDIPGAMIPVFFDYLQRRPAQLSTPSSRTMPTT